jgi:nitronate monooxygenase
MAISTAFTELLGILHPIVQAPMGLSAGGALAAAVSNGGGLGLLGGGTGDREWLDSQFAILAGATSRPWGVGFLSWAVDAAIIEHALELRPSVVMLSFGDPRPLAESVRRAGTLLMIQVTDLHEARRAVEVGADVIVAQGTESGGHGARRGWSTLPFVPVVVDLAAPTPVLAAGGIADGRGVAAALALGAAGALVGTRFQATAESLADPAAKKAIVDGSGEETERSSILDVARGSRWPGRYTARTLAHPLLDELREHEAERGADLGTGLEADQAAGGRARQAYRDGVARGDWLPMPVWAGEAAELITDLPAASDVVVALAEQAEHALARAAGRR